MNVRISQTVSACASLLAAGAFSTECLAEPMGAALPRPLIISSVPNDTELSWRNGERLNGELAGADMNYLRWQSTFFEDAIPLSHAAVRSVDFAGSPGMAEGPLRFVFVDGSHLTGTLMAIEGQGVSLSSASCGEMLVDLDQLVAIERISGPDVIVAGPACLLRGDAGGVGQGGKRPLYQSVAGEVVFLEFNGAVRQAVDLPEKCLVNMRLRIAGEPAFSVEMSTKNQSVRLETWDDELVLRQDESFASAGTVTLSADGVIDLQLGWDLTAGTCSLFDQEGKPMAELSLAKVAEPVKRRTSLLGALPLIGGKIEQLMQDTGVRQRPQVPQERAKGITLSNHGAGFVVERYSVTRWDGAPPQGMPEPDAGVGVTTAREFIDGELLACSGTTLTVRTAQGDREIPMDEVRSIRWPRPSPVGPEPPQTHLWYSDGNLLRGTLLGIADGRAQIATAFASRPVSASLEHCRALVFPLGGIGGQGGEEPELEKMDTIATGGVVLHGRVQPTGAVLPGFVPTGSDSALAPLAKDDLVLWRHLPKDGDHARAPALLNTSSNEALPVTVDQVGAEKIVFHWDSSEVTEIATSEIGSVQFPDPLVEMDSGFGSGGWRILGRTNAPLERTEKGLVLQPDTGIGHPYLLHGENFGFSFRKGESNTSFRVRLFCQGTNRNSESINFLVAHYSNSVYAGVERGDDGQFSSNRSIEVGFGDEPVRIDFKFTSDSVAMRVNNEEVAKSKIRKRKAGKSGRGLVIETTAVWGNSFGSLSLSDFSMLGSPIGIGAPNFDDDAKREALLLPRLRRDVPPRHILIGRNGDLLRGEIGAKSGSDILFRVGLEQYKVPIERVAAAVWVQEADKLMDEVKKQPAPTPVEEAPEAKPQEGPKTGKLLEAYSTQWLDLSDGGLLKLEVESWGEGGVVGDHELLGRCTIPTERIHRVSLSAPMPNSAIVALSGWKFEHTIDPNPPGQDEVDVSPLVGKPAPDFSLTMLEGGDFKLSEAKGKVVVLDFWATWCAPCVRSLPHVIEAMADFPPDKVAFLAVNQGEARKQVEQFMEIRGFKMPVGFDLEMKTGEKFGVESIPYTVVIDPAGKVTYVSLGASPDGARKLAEAVAAALPASDTE